MSIQRLFAPSNQMIAIERWLDQKGWIPFYTLSFPRYMRRGFCREYWNNPPQTMWLRHELRSSRCLWHSLPDARRQSLQQKHGKPTCRIFPKNLLFSRPVRLPILPILTQRIYLPLFQHHRVLIPFAGGSLRLPRRRKSESPILLSLESDMRFASQSLISGGYSMGIAHSWIQSRWSRTPKPALSF